MTAAAKDRARGLHRRRACGGRGAARRLRADAPAAQRLPLGQARRRRLAEARGPEPGPLLQDPRRLQRHAQGAGGAPDRRRFVCASAGNHAQGMAFACRHFGTEGVVFMPVTTPQQKIDKTRQFGGGRVEIRLVGDYFDETLRAAQAFTAETGALFLPPFDDADVIEGQATCALEIFSELPAPDLLVIPVGGGGLASGMVRVADALAPATEVRLVEPEGGPSLRRALEAGALVTLAGGRQLRRRRRGRPHRRPQLRGAAPLRAGKRAPRAGEPHLRHHGRDAERRGRGARARRRAGHRRAARPRHRRADRGRRGLRRQLRLRAPAGREGAGAALGGAEEILHPPPAAASRGAARVPRRPRPRGRHLALRVPEEVGAQLRLGAARHRDLGARRTSIRWRRAWPPPASPGSTSPTTPSSPA